MKPTILLGAFGLAIALAGATAVSALAAETQVQISLKGHRFDPTTLDVAAGKPVMIVVKNLDPTPAEFESKSLRVEKVVAGGGTITVRVRALKPGRYRFYDDYHEATTVGFVVAK